MKLTRQISMLFGVLITLPLIVFISIFYQRTYRLVEDQYVEDLSKDVPHVVSRMTEISEDFQSDLITLSNLSSVSGLLNATSEKEKEVFKGSVQNDFISLINSHEWYYQIRYIDEEGREIVRVDQVIGKPYIVPDASLQNKNDRAYFQEAMKLGPDVMYISELDLNIENGVLENRGTKEEPKYVPVIRFARVVKDSSGARRGIIITNIYADKFLSVLQQSSTVDTQYHLANIEGYFIFHPNEHKTFGDLQEGGKYSVKDEFPMLTNLNQSEYSFTQKYRNYLVKKINIFPEPDNPITPDSNKSLWTLVKVTDISKLRSQANFLMLRLLLYGVAIILVSVIIGYFFIQNSFSPLKALQEGTAIVAAGDLDHQISNVEKDEIGELAANFNVMVSALKKSRSSIEATVRERTARLTKLNKILIGRELKMSELKKKLAEMKKKYET